MKKKFKISVILIVNSNENYLKKSLECITKQTLNFNDNIELFIMDPTDEKNIEELCLEYKEKFPDNIKYYKEKETNINALRNKALKEVSGEIINFYNILGNWNKKAFKSVYNMFEENKHLNIIKGYDLKINKKYLNTIDNELPLQEELELFFFNVKSLKSKFFNTEVPVLNEELFLNQVLLSNDKVGFVLKNKYIKNKQQQYNIEHQKLLENKDYYIKTLNEVHFKLITISKEKYGKTLNFVQEFIINNLKSRLLYEKIFILNDSETTEYKNIIRNILKEIDDEFILKSKMHFSFKMYALSLKNGTNIINDVYLDGIKINYNDLTITTLNNRNLFKIIIMKIRNNKLYIEGTHQFDFFKNKYQIKAITNENKEIKIDFYENKHWDKKTFDQETILKSYKFKLEIPLEKEFNISFVLVDQNNEEHKIIPWFGKYAKLEKSIPGCYYKKDNFIVKYNKKKLMIYKKTFYKSLKSEIKFQYNLFKKKEFLISLYRTIAIIKKRFNKKPIWIISDRSNVARDNGEALFKYINNLKKKDKKVFFTVDRDSSDFKRMKSYGKVLKNNSFSQKLNFLICSKSISASFSDRVFNAFGNKEVFVKDLYDFDFIFLQHGIIANDMSRTLNKLNKNISLFVTSAKGEYDSIANGEYGYNKDEVILTGLCRYDYLKDESKKKIVFLPTWRKNIGGEAIPGTEYRVYSEKFKNSEYCKYYNKLINDKNLIKEMKKYGYTGELYIHPAFFVQAKDFIGNETIKVMDGVANYNKIFRENALLITDYSSVHFDFAYMKKPIVYSQFDIETFFKTHLFNSGYFSYDKDGFGPVVYNYNDTVNSIINYIKNDCKMEEKYKKNVDKFFAFTDNNNCKRVYDKIIELDEKNNLS